MKTIQRIPVPTGDILIVQGERGPLECLSIGDYGKDVNLKADFMDLNREPSPVRHTKLLGLDEKWVITISTQYGCDMGCSFCDVPKVGRGKNATFKDLVGQVFAGLELHPEVKNAKRLNLHYARMGEPTFNPDVLSSAIHLDGYFKGIGFGFHPVVSTMMPQDNKDLESFIAAWVEIKNELLDGNAGLQLSINSTCEEERTRMFRGNQCSLEEISEIMMPYAPNGRKFTLNFALGDWDIDPDVLKRYFNPAHYLCKLTPLHATRSVNSKGMMPDGNWTEYTPYKQTEEDLKAAGYDVIVFIASKEEDESRITCGNAILAHRKFELAGE